ncbi:MAG: YitT family protein [Lachnospiraceae bacterium]|mgnify:CR=1 FL=1|nr:YitT family protein [Lachnospiraceae bacterium]
MSRTGKNRGKTGSYFLQRCKAKSSRFFLMILGTALMATGINIIYEPLSMVTGGFSGIAIIVSKMTVSFHGGVPVWLTTLLLNLPLFAWAVKQRGFSYMKDMILSSFVFSFWLSVIPTFPLQETDYLMAALAGGALNGAGLALVFMKGMSTGGTDLLSSLLQWHLPHMSVAQILRFIDGAIVVLGIGIFGLRTGLYSIIAVYITTKVMDGILEGLKYAKMVYVISSSDEMISKSIIHDLDRGVTGIDVRGMYSGKERTMLLCIVSRKEVIHLTEIVEQNDKDAFVIVTDAREVMGEGFMRRS